MEAGIDTQLMEQGLELMLAGMGTVFAFLTLLVYATTGMSALVQRLQPVEPAQSGDATEEEVAAITVAIARHRSQ